MPEPLVVTDQIVSTGSIIVKSPGSIPFREGDHRTLRHQLVEHHGHLLLGRKFLIVIEHPHHLLMAVLILDNPQAPVFFRCQIDDGVYLLLIEEVLQFHIMYRAKFLCPLIPRHVGIVSLQGLILTRSIVIDVFQFGVRLEPDVLLQSFLVVILVMRMEPEELFVEKVHVRRNSQLILDVPHYILAFLAKGVALGISGIVVIFQFRESRDVAACEADCDNRTILQDLDLHAHDTLLSVEFENGQ